MAKPHEPAAASSTASPAGAEPQTTANATAKPTPNALDLPHERDQQGQTSSTPDPKMVQAKKDIDSGMVDTELLNQPGIDAGNMPSNLKHIPKT